MILIDESNEIDCIKLSSSNSGALTPERIKIMRLISTKPAYPAEIARMMNIPVQSIYYHIRELAKAGLVSFFDYEEHNGAIAKRYICKAKSIAIVIDKEGWFIRKKSHQKTPEILLPFIKNDFFDGRIIIGSPDPHGRYRARASEVGMLEFTMFLGRFASFEFPLYSLDTQLNGPILKKT